jgi:hypothetical protein
METHTCDAALELLREARERNETIKSIADGSGVPYQWLVRFARGEFEDPGSRKVEDVYRYLMACKTLERTRRDREEARPA